MTVDAGHGGGCLNFVAEIHRMPEHSWQCLDFRGTGQVMPDASGSHMIRTRLSIPSGCASLTARSITRALSGPMRPRPGRCVAGGVAGVSGLRYLPAVQNPVPDTFIKSDDLGPATPAEARA